MNKRKIFNDPVYGFISIPYDIVFDIIEHPYFQRLRRIQQLGLSSLVYPGATHSRFHHSLGAMHLMHTSLEVLKSKGHIITEQECRSAVLAILLHDLGHGPFSHALEGVLIPNTPHEHISMLLMQQLVNEFGDDITIAIQIFTDTYPKKYLHQLVSGQLDMDRLDYLNRDSFYSGVSEGVVGYDRIINMLEVHNDNIVVEEKAIYSIEKFIVARRLMYWQVYLHKTSLVADLMLKNTILRAKELALNQDMSNGISTNLAFFLHENLEIISFINNLDKFVTLDDYDIFQALKYWMEHEDKILSTLSTAIINRKLFKIEYADEILVNTKFNALKNKYNEEEMRFLVLKGTAKNNAYNPDKDNIFIKFKDGSIKEITEISEQWNIRSLSNPVVKHYIAYPK
ncbi:MAG TPA: HD domain-containing protein [Chitinophagales bacterium]|jgi:HD superfamily phosphohydrolase|nr:HD domain-containing protein [Chitinophagales bacterium]MBP6153685.1 HD domain-containing protein [Chitinophagales bacterium]HQV79067.1 HD domain-containing protein [Chitinophagales bacterium]HQW79810.1 HD domain-containing protein [Chitinophagales bacterium]HRB67748.1 HD domain-containing protein [Chitinophagales bacterium]